MRITGIRSRKKDELTWRIGRQSGGKASQSPKGVRKNGGLDVEAAGRHEEVQKGFGRTADWTLKRREDTRKSKKSEPEPRIGCQSGGKARGSPKRAS